MDSPIEKPTVVAVVVKDQEAALDFYTKTLGWRSGPTWLPRRAVSGA